MADNRERARALCEEHRIGGYECISVSSNVGKMVFHPNRYALAGITAALDAAFSRGSASIADEATVERVARALGEENLRTAGDPCTLKHWLAAFWEDDYPTQKEREAAASAALRALTKMALAALAAIPAPPAPLKETKT